MAFNHQTPFVPSSIELVEMRPSRDLARAVSTRVLGFARTLLDTNGMECGS